MFVPFAGSLAGAETINRKGRSISVAAVRKFEDFICRINVLFPPSRSHALFSTAVTCLEVAVSVLLFRIGTSAMTS